MYIARPITPVNTSAAQDVTDATPARLMKGKPRLEETRSFVGPAGFGPFQKPRPRSGPQRAATARPATA